VIPATILIGLGFYMFHNTLQTNATQMAPFDRSSAITLFAFVLFGGQALGALLLGHIGEVTGYVPVFLFAGIGLMVLAWLFAFAKQRQN
jgi:predicted MFS family arabinose efflux permease